MYLLVNYYLSLKQQCVEYSDVNCCLHNVFFGITTKLFWKINRNGPKALAPSDL